MPQGFSFSKKPDYEKRRAKGFRLPFFGTRQGGTGMAFAGSCKGQNGFAKERRRTKPFLKRPEGTLFCSLQFTRFSAERPCGTSSAAGPYGMPPPNMAQPCRTRYIINDLRRRPFFPPHMGCPARAPHPPLFRQTRQLSGCFRPPMRRLRAEMDAIAHARDNSRPSDGCRACRHSSRLAHCGRCQIHASSTDRSLSAIRHFSALREKPMPRFSMRDESFPDEHGL